MTTRVRALDAVALVAFLSAGCQSPMSPSVSLPLTPIASVDDCCAFKTETLQVVRDPATWQDLWSRITSDRSSPPGLPSVDFGSAMLVVAAMGTQASGGFRVEVTAATAQVGAATIEITETSPGTHCAVATLITSPVSVVSLPIRQGDVVFHVMRQVVDCR